MSSKSSLDSLAKDIFYTIGKTAWNTPRKIKDLGRPKSFCISWKGVRDMIQTTVIFSAHLIQPVLCFRISIRENNARSS